MLRGDSTSWRKHPIGHSFASRSISIAHTPDNPNDYELNPDYFEKRLLFKQGILPDYFNLKRNEILPSYDRKLKEKSLSITPNMKKVATSWVKGQKTQRDKLESIYKNVTLEIPTIYYLRTILLKPHRFLKGEAKDIWARRKSGGEACHTQSILLRGMLLGSGKFKPDEVKFGVAWSRSIPHTFLNVYLRDEKKWVIADPMRQDYTKGASKNPILALYKNL